MPRKIKPKTEFESQAKISSFFTGGRVQFAGNDREFVLCPKENSINVVRIADGRIVATASHDEDDEISCFCYSNDSLITASRSLLLKKWNLQPVINPSDDSEHSQSDLLKLEAEKTWKAVHSGPVMCMDMDPSCSFLATGSSDQTVKVFDLTRQYHTHNVRGFSALITNVRFWVLDGHYLLISTCDHGKMQITHLKSSKCLKLLENAHYGAINSLDISVDYRLLVTVGKDSIATVWSVTSFDEDAGGLKLDFSRTAIAIYETAESLFIASSKQISHLEGRDDECVFVVAGTRGVFKIWNAKGECLLAFGKLSSSTSVSKSAEDACDLAPIYFMHRSGDVFIAASYSHDLFIYSLKSLKVKKTMSGDPEEISGIASIGQNPELFAVASKNKFLKVINTATSNVNILPAHQDVIISLSASVDGSLLATCGKDNTAKLWTFDPEEGKLACCGEAVGHTMDVLDCRFSTADNSFLVSVSEDLTLKLWKLPKSLRRKQGDGLVQLKCKWTMKAHEKQINCCDVSPQNKMVATGSHDKLIKLWNVESQTFISTLIGHRKGIWSVCFSREEQLLASASGDSTVRVWNLADQACLSTLEGHDCAVLQVAFFNHSTQLVSAATNGLLKLWDVKSNECQATLDQHTDKVWALSVVEKGKETWFGSAGADAELVLWKDVTAEKRALALEEQGKLVSNNQMLDNLLLEKQYVKAVGLAISLNQPYRLLSILQTLLAADKVHELSDVIGELRQDQMASLLKFCVIWNANTRNCHSAQAIMQIVFRTWPPDKLLELVDIQDTVEKLLSYQERHYSRLEKLQQQTMLVDFTRFCIKDSTQI